MSATLFSDQDPEGEMTLEAMAVAPRFNQWIYETIAPFCRGNILEVGSGIGNISEFFLKNGSRITLSDIRPAYCNRLGEKFAGYRNLESVVQLDLADVSIEKKFSLMKESFDTVFALNVIEHIGNDHLAVKNIRQFLPNGGRIIILVPAYQALYNGFDKNLGHFRRYNLKSLNRLMVSNGFKIIYHQYFNIAGILGWFLSGSVIRKATIPKGQMKIYNMMVPLFKVLDKAVFNSAGLSVISVGEAI
ncbi:MAG TPA: class I SAM-dependent methyltransferase [Cyclobacteriaceae bacterium]|nr:class I SAM-dependent methyltransferase [Cyclobacteriaceae bacterium]